MMHSKSQAVFLDDRRALLTHGLQRHSRRFRGILLAFALLLGSSSVVHATTATWNANPESDIAGYTLSFGTQPGAHPNSVNVLDVTTWLVSALTPGQKYYFVVQAYNTSAMTSAPSAEVAYTVPVAPSITSLNPSSGVVGSAVTIAGANFGATPGTSTVTFNGTPAATTTWSDTSIVVAVPAGATTGSVIVTVGGLTSNAVGFTVMASPPGIASLSPTSGTVGTAVTIAGANFGTTQGASTVTFNGNGATATPTSWSDTAIIAPVPSGARTGSVVVTVNGLSSNPVSFTVTASAPSITSLSPTSGAVGLAVTIAGANFGSSQGTSSVTFNGTAATPTSWNDTSISVPVPSGATTGSVVVTVGSLVSNGVGFTVSAITLTQHANISANGASAALAFPSNNTAGKFIAVAVRAFNASQTITVSDSRGNVYQQAFKVNNGSDDTLAIYYAQNIAAGANTVTVAVSTSASIRFAILEYTGVAIANALDVIATSALSSGSPSTGPATTTANGDLLIAAFATQSPWTFTAGSGYTVEEAVSAAPSTELMVEDATQVTAGAVSAAASLSSSDNWGAGLAAFRKAAPVAATLTSPANGATNVDMTQPMQWTTVAGVQAYYLYGGLTIGTNDLINTGEIQQTSYLATGLPASTTVFARLWTKLGGVWIFSDSSFTTAAAGVPVVATLTSPVNGATNVDMMQPMQWTTVAAVQAYYLYVGSTLGAKDLVNTGEIQQTSYLATGVPGNQTVFARLWTKVGGVWRSSDSSFTTAATATLTSPVNGATNVDMTLPMRWTTVVGVQAYYLYVGSTLGGKDLVNTGEIQQTSYLATGLPGSQTVFARLWTKAGGVWRSSDSTFTTAAATVPVIATLTSPINGATNVDMTLPMQWTTVAGVQAYYLYVGSTLGAKDLLNTGEIQQTSYLATGLPASTTVFARLWTKVGGVWRSSDSSFTTR